MSARALFNRIFRLEEINGHNACPTYLYRWTLIKFGGYGVYVHKFVGDDWSRDMHDHPKRFVSIGIKGRYIEETPFGAKEFRAPWVRTFPATHIHRIRMHPGETAWTLVIVLRTSRKWGFWRAGKWVPWRTYVENDADARKSCL